MILQHQPPLHLTYCLNIHPGESWAENLAAIREKAVRVKQFVSPDEWFGLGLRIAAHAAEELAADGALREEALAVFAEHGLYPFSVNAFPFGKFHGGRVKENVYAPDWRSPARRDYTMRVADILAGWLPEAVDGSISTVPGSFKDWIKTADDTTAMAQNLGIVAAYLAALREDTGKEIHLGLEPEPSCFLETTPETLAFFREHIWTAGIAEVSRIRGRGETEAGEIVRRHIGVCFDTCHVALQFEDPVESLRAYRAEGIRISKVQLSAALMTGGSEDCWDALLPFAEGVYLHQVKARTADGEIRSWTDLPIALADDDGRESVEEARVHFHVPLFFQGNGPLASTVSTLTPEFFRELRRGATSHVEIETYTFDVLPADIRPTDVVRSIAREFEWVAEYL
jgi:sugar phosphate isomerase/epimerase